jgi:hypothetical protein
MQEVVRLAKVSSVSEDTVSVSEVEVDESSKISHNDLLDRDLEQQHTIKSIIGLSEELDKLNKLKNIESRDRGVAQYYAWNSPLEPNDNKTGYFVSLVDDTIKLCTGKEDNVFGVIVSTDDVGLVGGVGGAMFNKISPIDSTRYGLVCNSGKVKVRSAYVATVGDYVVPNVLGMAQKSETESPIEKWHFQIIEVGDTPRYSLTYEPINTISVYVVDNDSVGESVDYVTDSTASGKKIAINGTQVEIDISTGGYVKGNKLGFLYKHVTNKGIGYKVIEYKNENGDDYVFVDLSSNSSTLTRLQDDVNYLNSQISVVEKNVVAAINMANAAYNKAGGDSDDVEGGSEEINMETLGLITNAQLTVDNVKALVEQVNKDMENVKDIASEAKEAAATVTDDIESLWAENGALAESTKSLIGKVAGHSVGTASQANGLSFEQAQKILDYGIVYVPTVDRLETYEDKEQVFYRNHSYTWSSNGWDDNGANVYFRSTYRDGSIGQYWYTDSVEDVVDSNGITWPKETLYLWNDEKKKWDAVATLDNNGLGRAVSLVQQTENEFKVAIAGVDGQFAGINARIDGVNSRIDSIASSGGGNSDSEAVAAVKLLASKNEASITQITEFGNNVYSYTSVSEAPSGTYYAIAPTWKNNAWVFSGSTNTSAGNLNGVEYCYAKNPTNAKTYYKYECDALNQWTRIEIGRSTYLAGIKQQADANGATVGMIVEGIGENGQVNGATIAAAVNKEGSLAMINADHIQFEGFVSFANKSDVKDVQNNAVYETKVEYALSNSATTFDAYTNWSTTAPVWQAGKYMWQRITITKGDGTTAASTQTCIQGAKGEDGTGVTIKGVAYVKTTVNDSSIGSEYALYSDESCTNQITSVEDGDSYLVSGYLFVYSGNGSDFTCAGKIQGPQGEQGVAGVGVSNVINYYMASSRSSGVVAGDNGETADEQWTTDVQIVSEDKPYLWNYETMYYTDTNSKSTDPVIMGMYGAEGKGISAIEEFYCVTSESSCSKPTNDTLAAASAFTGTAVEEKWYTTSPYTTQTLKYLWNCEKVTYTDGDYQIFDPANIGTHGDTGATIKSEKTQFYISSSNDTCVGGSWGDSPSGFANNKYMWTRTVYTLTNNDVIYGTPVFDKSYTSISRWCAENDETLIDGANIATGSITAEQIAAETITAEKIAAGAITADHMSTDSLEAIAAKVETATIDTIVSSNYVPNQSGFKITTTDGVIDSKNLKVYEDGNVELTGTVFASRGEIGGNTIDETGLHITNGEITLGDKFSVTTGGVLTASSADITGKITTDEGEIGGFTINSDRICKDVTMIEGKDNHIASGGLKTGSILLSSKSKTYGGTIAGGSGQWRFIIGTNFGVTGAGKLHANNAKINGEITATNGRIGSLKIADAGLNAYDANETETIWTLDNTGLSIPSDGARIEVGNLQIYNTVEDNTVDTNIKTSGNLEIRAANGAGISLGAKDGSDSRSIAVAICAKSVVGNGTHVKAVITNNATPFYDLTIKVLCKQYDVNDTLGEYNVRTYAANLTISAGKSESNECCIFGTISPYLAIKKTDDSWSNAVCFKDLNYPDSYTSIMDNYNTYSQSKLNETISVTGHLVPSTTSYDLGTSAKCWKTIYSQDGTVSKSDRNEKNTINGLTEIYTQIFDALQPVSYKFNVNNNGRTHIGFIAQDVKQAVESAGLTTQDFAGYCEWEKDDGTIGCGLRYGEFVAMNTYEIQKLKARVAELEDKIALLTGQN